MKSVSLWTRHDPFAEFDALIRGAFGPVATRPSVREPGSTPATSATGAATTGAFTPAAFTPAAEVVRDGEDAVVRLELPGLDIAQDVTVEVDRGQLVVRGERRDERADTRDSRSLREVRYGSFRRSFTLPTHVTADAVSAAYDAGILSVRVAGAYAGSQPQRIAVTGAPAVEATA